MEDSDAASDAGAGRFARRKWLWSLGAVLVGALVIAAGWWWQWWGEPKVVAGVRASGIPLSGMTKQQAERALQTAAQQVAQSLVALSLGDRIWQKKAHEVGISLAVDEMAAQALQVGRKGSWWEQLKTRCKARFYGFEVPAHYRLDESAALACLKAIAPAINSQPKRALVELQGSYPRIIPSKDGLKLDEKETLSVWKQMLGRGDPAAPLFWHATVGVPYHLPLKAEHIAPDVRTDDVAHINGIVSQFSTPLHGSRSRIHNMRLAMKALDHILIRPGEVFSYNKQVGPRLPSRGFRIAPVFINGRIDRDFGGGVCQVATTLYNVALFSGMTIVQRQCHSLPVKYVPLGQDATAVFGAIDLKFRNDTPHPIYLRTFVGGGRVRIVALGMKEGDEHYRIERKVLAVIPARTFIKPDPALRASRKVVEQKGHNGYRVITWRVRVTDGQVIARERLGLSFYRPQPHIIRVGTRRIAPPSPPPSKPTFPKPTEPPEATEATEPVPDEG